MGMEMSMGMGARDGGDAMTKGWALLILVRKLCFDFVSLALPQSILSHTLSLSSVCMSVAVQDKYSDVPFPFSFLLLLLLGLLRFCLFRVPLLLGPRQLFW
jgi:hypothetical protein